MVQFNWTCPFCNHSATIQDPNYVQDKFTFENENIHGKRMVISTVVVCPNENCKEFTLIVQLSETVIGQSGYSIPTKILKRWNLIPASQAKVFPSYIPKPILDDYYEACLIKELSPKASASLSRRCLQGMIRDFWKVVKPKLSEEIDGIKDKVEPKTWEAIDAVRKVGNIGAHMEKDVNLVIDVDPNEAELLIDLIEILIEDWYISRYTREERMNKVIELGKQKDAQKKGNTP